LIEIINKQLLLQLVGYLCYWQMGFNSVFKGLRMHGACLPCIFMASCIRTKTKLRICINLYEKYRCLIQSNAFAALQFPCWWASKVSLVP